MTFWTIAFNDLKLTYKDKMFLFWLLVFPLIFIFIFGLAFRDMGPGDSQVTLNVLDKDKSFLSKTLIEELVTEKYDVKVFEKDEEKSFRTLIIPEGFSQSVFAGEKVELKLEQEQGNSLEAMQTAYSHVLKAVIKILAKIVMVSPENPEIFEEKLPQLNWERRIILRTELGGELKAIPSGYTHSVPSSTVVFLLFTVMMYGGVNLLEERRKGQLERIYLSPATFSSIIGGKWLGRIIIGMFQIFILFVLGKYLFGIYLGPSLPALFLTSLFFCATIAGMSMLFGSIIKKEEILIVFNILFLNLMAALGGCWWPIEVVPKGMKTVGKIFPTSWIMDAYSKLIFFGYGLEAVLVNMAVLAGFTALFLFLAIKFFKIRK
jgi:ABC-2 type transport system permease protein